MLTFLSACSPVAVLNALAPKVGITETRNIRYAHGDRHELDVYAPAGQASAPVVVFIYGGGWKHGDRSEYRFVAAALAARGFLTVIPNYRLFHRCVFLPSSRTMPPRSPGPRRTSPATAAIPTGSF